MHKLVEEYIEKVKSEVLNNLNLYEKVYCPIVFKSQLDRARFPQRNEYTANVLNMMVAYKCLVGYDEDEADYERICNEFWGIEVIEYGKDFILFKRYKEAPIDISEDDFWNLVKYAMIAPDGQLNFKHATDEIMEKIDNLADSVENLAGLIEEHNY